MGKKTYRQEGKRMAGKLFREKNIEKVTSPEQLNDYIRVTSPGVCLTLGAVLVFLVCVCVWAAAGTLDITVQAKGLADGKLLYCYLDEEEIRYVREGMAVRTETGEGTVTGVSEIPDDYETMVQKLGGESMVHALHIQEGEWRYLVEISREEDSEGLLDISIVTERVSPISYMF